MDRQSLLINLVTAAIVGLGTAALAGGGNLAAALYAPGPLHSKHASAACTTCHQPVQGVTGQGCLSGNCHTQAEIDQNADKPFVAALHRDPASRDCTACHPDHRGTAAPLTVAFHQGGRGLLGARAENCTQCHQADSQKAHPDILDQNCAACHPSTQSWKEITFDHSLLAAGARQICQNCHHRPRDWFHGSVGGMSCAECHSTRRWEPSTFRHPRIPEMGEHMEEAGCRGCHPTSWQRARSCESCHGRGGFFDD